MSDMHQSNSVDSDTIAYKELVSGFSNAQASNTQQYTSAYNAIAFDHEETDNTEDLRKFIDAYVGGSASPTSTTVTPAPVMTAASGTEDLTEDIGGFVAKLMSDFPDKNMSSDDTTGITAEVSHLLSLFDNPVDETPNRSVDESEMEFTSIIAPSEPQTGSDSMDLTDVHKVLNDTSSSEPTPDAGEMELTTVLAPSEIAQPEPLSALPLSGPTEDLSMEITGSWNPTALKSFALTEDISFSMDLTTTMAPSSSANDSEPVTASMDMTGVLLNQTNAMDFTEVITASAPSAAPMELTQVHSVPDPHEITDGFDIDFARLLNSAGTPEASPVAAAAIAQSATPADTPYATMEFTQVLSAAPRQSSSPNDTMEFTGLLPAPTRSPNDTLELTQLLRGPRLDVADDTMDLTGLLQPSALPQASASPNDTMEFTTLFRPQQFSGDGNLTMEFTDIVSAPATKTAPQEDSPSANNTMEFTAAFGSGILSRRRSSVTPVLKDTTDPMDFTLTGLLPPRRVSLVSGIDESMDADSTQNFTDTFVTLLRDAQRMEVDTMDIDINGELEELGQQNLRTPSLLRSGIAQSTPMSAMRAVREVPLQFAQFLNEMDLLRAYQIAAKSNSSLSLTHPYARPISTIAPTREDMMRSRYHTAPESAHLAQTAEQLRSRIAELEARNNELESRLNQQPPSLMTVCQMYYPRSLQEYPNMDAADKLLLAHRLRRLWRNTRLGVKLRLESELCELASQRTDRLHSKLSAFRSESSKANRFINSLATLETSIKFDLNELRQQQRAMKSIIYSGDEISGGPRFTLSDERERDIFAILTGALGWVPQQISTQQLTLRYCEHFQLLLNLNIHAEGQLVTDAVFTSTLDGPKGEFLQALAASLNVETAFTRIQTATELRTALSQLAISCSRLSRLLKELECLMHSHPRVRLDSASRSVAVCFSNATTQNRFYVSFELDGQYPAAPLSHKFIPSFGNVTAGAVQAALDATHTACAAAPYRQLTLLCAALDALCAAR